MNNTAQVGPSQRKSNTETLNSSLGNKLWKCWHQYQWCKEKRKKCPAAARRCNIKPWLHVPPTSAPTENAVPGTEKKKTSLRINANPRLSRSQNTNHTAHGHSRQVDNEDRKARVRKSPLHPPLPSALGGTLCQICLKSSESLAPFLSGMLETSLRWHGWTSEILPSNKQTDIQLSNLHKTKNNSLAFET